jgi:hypothetical protein
MDNYEDEIVEETIETPEEDDSTELEEVDDSEDDVEEAQEGEVDWEARAKKAEAAIIKAKSKPKAKTDTRTGNGLSTFDLLALQKANIETEEDLDEVVRWADYNKISVSEALKSNILKATLSEKAEERKSALVVNTGSGRRAGGTVSDERLMADAKKGIMPDNPEDIAKLARMRIGKK